MEKADFEIFGGFPFEKENGGAIVKEKGGAFHAVWIRCEYFRFLSEIRLF